MAESGSFNTSGYDGRYLKFSWSIKSKNPSSNYVDINWKLVGAGTASHSYYISGNFKVVIDGDTVYSSTKRIDLYNGTKVASGTKRLNNASNRKFSASAQAGIYTVSVNCKGSGSWTLPTLAVNPTIPTWINVSGNSGTWVNKDNPKFSASWGGATKGTYTIDRYSVDIAKYGTDTWKNEDNVYTSKTSGSISNSSITSLGTLSGGTKLQVRVGMRTTSGKWWGHIYWNGVLNVYSSPTAPTTFTAPSSVEIDKGFNLTWSGAKAGSNGIAGYDLEARAYNGSSWTGWVRIFSTKNQSSYSVSKIKNLTVNGVNYSKNGESVKFQYRIRTTDGKIATSGWKNSGEIGILINSPTVPRKFVY